MPAWASKLVCGVVSETIGESDGSPLNGARYTPIPGVKAPSKVIDAGPVRGAVQEYQTVRESPSNGTGSASWNVATTVVPPTEPVSPVMSAASTKASVAGPASAHWSAIVPASESA